MQSSENLPEKSSHLLKPYFVEGRLKIFWGLISLITVDVLQLLIPRIIKWAVDDLTQLTLDLRQLMVYAGYMVVIAVLIGIFRYIWRRCLLGTSRRIEEGLRNRLFSHLQGLSAEYFDRVKTGDLMAHATNDLQQIRMATGMGMVALNDAVVLGAAAIGFMAYINVELTLLVLIPMPLIVIGTRFFSKKMHRQYQTVQAAFSELTEIMRERFAGIRVIKAHGRERGEAVKVEKISRNYINDNIRLARITGAFFPMMLFLTNISMAMVLYFGGRLTILQTITAGDFVAFISYLGLLTWPMMALGWVTNLIQRGRASLDRIHHILQSQPKIKTAPGALPLRATTGCVEFEGVDFSYPSTDGNPNHNILKHVDLSIQPGQTLGIIGPPGSGKTTLLSLIPRLYDASGGRILINGKNIRNLVVEDLRSHIGFMPQEPFIFAGSIRDNITFGEASITDDQLTAAVKGAALEETISDFPHGYETIVGEKGVILSGGQKQRIALARCLLKPSAIMILDDPISQVDLKTGRTIIDTLRAMAVDRTTIIVSHRLSAVKFADTIIVLDEGRISEAGTHEELMQSSNYYADTYYFQEVEEEFNAH